MQTCPRNTSIFDFHGKPPLAKALPISLQHVLAMVAGVITPPIIIAGVVGATPAEKLLLIQIAVLASGVCTLFHLYGVWKFGARLPAIFGVGFAYVPTLVAVGGQFGIAGILGAQLVGGITMMVVGYFIQYIRHLFPPVVAGTVVLVIGLSLYDIAIRYMAGSGNVDAPGFGPPSTGPSAWSRCSRCWWPLSSAGGWSSCRPSWSASWWATCSRWPWVWSALPRWSRPSGSRCRR